MSHSIFVSCPSCGVSDSIYTGDADLCNFQRSQYEFETIEVQCDGCLDSEMDDGVEEFVMTGERATLGSPSDVIAELSKMVEDSPIPLYRESYINIVFDGPPSHESGRFVDVEDDSGNSVNVGEWVERDDGYFALRLPWGGGTSE